MPRPKGAPLERHVPAHMSRSIVSLERAFANIQRNVCQIVYAKAEDLSRLFTALDTIDKSASLLPIWIAIETIEEGRALSISSQEQREQHIALRRQEVEAAARLEEERNRQTAIMRENTQNEVRRRYSQEARAAHNDLSELSKAFLARDGALREQFALLFPEMRQWRDQQVVNGWLLDEYQDELIDYGTAVWKDRRLEAVFVRANLVTKNSLRGEYNQKCVVLGYLIDSEFEMRRDALEVPCTVTDDVAKWKTGRQFESRWVAP